MNQLTTLPRKPKENNRAYAYRILHYNIMTMVLPPGTALNENEVAEQLGTSRTPVHEALTLLTKDYLVEIRPQSGSFISRISLRNVREGLFMRSTLEPAIYRQLAGNISKEDLNAISANLEHTRQMIPSGKDDFIDPYIKLDDKFHKLAYLAAGKPILWASVTNVCSHFQRIRYQEYQVVQTNLTHVYDEHRQLYEYLLFGGSAYFDLDSFYEQHLSYFKTYLPKLISTHPDYYIMD